MEVIRDNLQKIIGYIETKHDGSQIARNSNQVIVGYYEPNGNATRNANRVIVGYGNQLVSLITK